MRSVIAEPGRTTAFETSVSTVGVACTKVVSAASAQAVVAAGLAWPAAIDSW